MTKILTSPTKNAREVVNPPWDGWLIPGNGKKSFEGGWKKGFLDRGVQLPIRIAQ